MKKRQTWRQWTDAEKINQRNAPSAFSANVSKAEHSQSDLNESTSIRSAMDIPNGIGSRNALNNMMRASYAISCGLLTRSHCLIYLLTRIMRIMFGTTNAWQYSNTIPHARYACIYGDDADDAGRPFISLIFRNLRFSIIDGIIVPVIRNLLMIRHQGSVGRHDGCFRESVLRIICPLLLSDVLCVPF
jgi:hypothetical protein